MKLQKYHYVIEQDELLSITEDTDFEEQYSCDWDGYTTVVNLESLEEMKDEITNEDKIKKINKAIKLINKLADKDGCKPNKINLVVNRQ